MNIVNPIKAYDRGVCARYACLTRKDNIATQPCEVAQRICPDEFELLLFRQVEGVAAVAARGVRDNIDAFRLGVREDI